MTTVERSPFGTLADGTAIEKITMTGAGGLTACVLTYGATLQALTLDDIDMALGFDTVEGYVHSNGSYQGATIGRFANRIGGARFVLNGREYRIGCNEKGRGALHGGCKGFESKVWIPRILSDGSSGDPSVAFTCCSPDGDEGFPGTLTTTVTYTVTDGNILRIAYDAVTDADTPCSLTNHTYFNLGGYDSGDILDTVLCLDADAVTPIDRNMIPTGEIRPVAGTVFDFRTPKSIGQDWETDDEQLRIGNGYDVNYVLNGSGFRPILTARSPKTGIEMTVSTDLPGVQFYAGGTLNEVRGKGGVPLYRCQGFCFETQFFPDSPNKPAFPDATLRAGERFESVTEFAFARSQTEQSAQH